MLTLSLWQTEHFKSPFFNQPAANDSLIGSTFDSPDIKIITIAGGHLVCLLEYYQRSLAFVVYRS